jgi:hypothetical protein
MTIDGFRIDYWIYCDTFTARDYTSQVTVTHRLMFSVTVLGSCFQRRTFLCFRGVCLHRVATISHHLVLWPLASFYTHSLQLLVPGLDWLPTSFLRDEITGNQSQVKVILRPTVSRPVFLGEKSYLGSIITVKIVAGLLSWGALSEGTNGLSFTIAAGPRHRRSGVLLCALSTDRVEHTTSNSASILSCPCCLVVALVLLPVYAAIA